MAARILPTSKAKTGKIHATAHAASSGLALQGDKKRATVRLLDGDLVNCDPIFPAEFAEHLVVATAPLIDAVKGIALVAERESAVRLTFSAGSVMVEAGSGDDAHASVVLDAAVCGEEQTIAANPAHLLDGLGALGAAAARIAYAAPGNPAVLTGQSALVPARLARTMRRIGSSPQDV